MKNILDEFKEFALKGNLIELAVAFILGLAFSAVVTSLVDDVILQIIAAIVGQPNFNGLTIDLGGTPIRYGAFLTAFALFLLVAFVLLLIVRTVNELQRPSREAPAPRDSQLPLLLHRDSGCRDPVQRMHE